MRPTLPSFTQQTPLTIGISPVVAGSVDQPLTIRPHVQIEGLSVLSQLEPVTDPGELQPIGDARTPQRLPLPNVRHPAHAASVRPFCQEFLRDKATSLPGMHVMTCASRIRLAVPRDLELPDLLCKVETKLFHTIPNC